MLPTKKEDITQYTSLGGYTILYLDRYNSVLCAECAKKEDGPVYACSFDEGEPEACEECGREIESSYGPVEENEPAVGCLDEMEI